MEALIWHVIAEVVKIVKFFSMGKNPREEERAGGGVKKEKVNKGKGKKRESYVVEEEG